MLKGKKQYIILILGIAFIAFTELNKPPILDWSPTFSSTDKIPYGAFVLFELLKDVFPENELIVSEESIYNDPLQTDDSTIISDVENTNLIVINANSEFDYNGSATSMDKYEVETLLEYTARGNNVFMASTRFSSLLTDTLHFDMLYQSGSFSFIDSVEHSYCLFDTLDYTIKENDIKFVFDSIKYENATVFAEYKGLPILVKFPFGKGSFLLSTSPKLYSNYFMLKNNNYDFLNYEIAENTFKLLPPQTTYWDEYYKLSIDTEISEKGPLSYILSVRALKWALYTALFGLILLMLFKSKRLQSTIPIVEPESNLDVDFATTIGQLYYNEGNHADLAKKKILYWKEYVRNRYNIETKHLNERFKKSLSFKTELSIEEVNKLVDQINGISRATEIDKYRLIAFNQKLDKFYNRITNIKTPVK